MVSPPGKSHAGEVRLLDPCKVAAAVKMPTVELEAFALSLGFPEDIVRDCDRDHAALVALLRRALQLQKEYERGGIAHRPVRTPRGLEQADELEADSQAPPRSLREAIDQEDALPRRFQVAVVLPHGKRVRGHVEPQETIGSLMARLDLPPHLGLATPSGRMLPEVETVEAVHMQAGDEIHVQRIPHTARGSSRGSSPYRSHRSSHRPPSSLLDAVGLG